MASYRREIIFKFLLALVCHIMSCVAYKKNGILFDATAGGTAYIYIDSIAGSKVRSC